MIFSRKRLQEPRLDLTSLVDVVFLLLIFFMISTTFIEAPGLGIQLPKASTQRPTDPKPEVKVSLNRSGAIFIEGEPITLDALSKRLQAALKKDPESRFVLLADQDTSHGRVVQLMDLAQQSGFAKLAIATQPESIKKK